ncbi:hypothetical protein HAX54_050471 [Datura stramonium]|uniref:Uncharacterized protein n=1 Tax=Datura stramonium TaxID=4076 RepID=A0ABS8WQA9_DATST|nr:hypothetical protein [Datura stramonium]
MSSIRVDLVEEGTNDVDGYDKVHFTNPNAEVSDESDDLQNVDSTYVKKKHSTSPSVDDPTIDKCMYILANIPEGSGIYNYTMNMFLKKGICQVFLMTTDAARKTWLKYNYQLHVKKM